MLAKRTYKNQITIPKAVMAGFEGIEYFDVQEKQGAIILKPVMVQSREEELETIRGKIEALGITEKDVKAAVLWARHNAPK